MKPQKRVRIEVGSPLFRIGKGTVLTLDEARGKYVSDSGKLYNREWIEALQSPIVSKLSVDGFTAEEIYKMGGGVGGPNVQYYYDRGGWDRWKDTIVISSELHRIRLKPQPEYIPVPGVVKLGNKSIINGERALYIGGDGYPVMRCLNPGERGFKHKIDPTPITEFENRGIYLFSYTNTNLKEDAKYTGNYGIFCAKENRMYFFDIMKGYAVSSMFEPKLANFRKVVPA